ncbi:inner membrane-spanning protein YciB [Candidatus Kinetoplastidibacterium crithidiae]|uniref:Inner membrane-spanning protein YciB n=1 Tax=Candidatus Kinetoplastidibacterium crithidiae TCC036E TaxID=1208918 RepID=M1LQ90_9PROT|nr:septation protein IspZ [Candidatus Kinetoplastibacterium crithidii]AFZ82576.1 intracellular septation protein [Candidatus Kinetoplastibacterium crithidii (ex Angomonas deanei ATCC 30255)]AGF47762.1 intracellular septation protein [Candidatus Kinetoplastibacterium crithidii TCC036E]
MNKIIIDIFPISVFFLSYNYTNDIYIATKILVLLCILQLIFLKLQKNKTDNIMVLSTLLVIIMGTATVVCRNDFFIKLKPTIIYLGFAISMLIANVFFKKNLVYIVLHKKIKLPIKVWNNLNVSWICFFVMLSLLNSFVAFSGLFTQKTWVNFRTFGILSILLTYAFIQLLLIRKHIKHKYLTNKE